MQKQWDKEKPIINGRNGNGPGPSTRRGAPRSATWITRRATIIEHGRLRKLDIHHSSYMIIVTLIDGYSSLIGLDIQWILFAELMYDICNSDKSALS